MKQVIQSKTKNIKGDMNMRENVTALCNVKKGKEPETKNIVENFRERLINSEKVQLYGSINSGNYMINIEDAVEILKQCVE